MPINSPYHYKQDLKNIKKLCRAQISYKANNKHLMSEDARGEFHTTKG